MNRILLFALSSLLSTMTNGSHFSPSSARLALE